MYIFTIFDTKTASKSALEWAENPGVNCFRLSGSSTTENKIENFKKFSITFTFHAPKNAEIFFLKMETTKENLPQDQEMNEKLQMQEAQLR